MRPITLKQARVSYGKHEVISSPHVDCQMHRSRVYEHGREVRVVDIASRDVPQQVPVSRHKEAGEMDCAVCSDNVPCDFRNGILLFPPLSRQFSCAWRTGT
jgi:hypothetical protein